MCEDVKTDDRFVFLFKSQSEDAEDKYSKLLTSFGFTAVLVPTLSFKFCNESILQSYVADLAAFSAVIFTSPRAVQAVVNLIPPGGCVTKIYQITCYVVGHATSLAASNAGFQPLGEESGNAESLSETILRNYKEQGDNRPILFPCSNLRRDVLLDSLHCHDVPVTEVVAYQTHSNEQLKDILQNRLATHGVPEYAVFFSPSCFQFAYPVFESLEVSLSKIKLIAIGPTTHKAITEQGYTTCAVAARPDPRSLLEAIKSS